MECRLYQPQDREAYIALMKRVFPDDPPWKDPALSLDLKVAFQPELMFVAMQGAQMLGTVMAGYDGHRGWIYSVATDPAQRGRGIASRLLEMAEAKLASLGCVKINLQVREGNEAVVAVYEKNGYQVEPRISMGKILHKPDD
ncbi:GNAT family acetyltransferase [Aestuariispira insulae]|uniref:N-acetyltransferase domain-containing protein n=1 Tax=Aestuariispira insulae TaxID=1461337 RepID=A0A3D9H6N2_9PROT|nr:GNAT family acetyltransferase [Aestuariispira insulae]RED45122.1 hypothetical protein DFP90_112116 [Aestuariispira insulae]